MPFISLLQAAPATSSGSLLMTVLPLALIFVIFYFFMIRPQNKKQKETEKMIAALKKGDKVITIGGIHGTVSSTKEKTVIVKVDDNTKIEFLRSAVSTVVTDKAEKNGKKDTVEAVTAEAEKAIEEEKK
jgi:preprotein translocase subunit YajC